MFYISKHHINIVYPLSESWNQNKTERGFEDEVAARSGDERRVEKRKKERLQFRLQQLVAIRANGICMQI